MKAVFPNLLTLSRVFLMPLSLYFFWRGPKELSFYIYVFIALTDYWDGYFARKWKVTSSLGVVLDQICDKLVGLGFFTGFLLTGLCPSWFLSLLVCISILLGFGYLFSQLPPFNSGPQVSLRLGKWSTALQYLWVGWLILEEILFGNSPHLAYFRVINDWGFASLGALQILVFLKYFFRFFETGEKSSCVGK